MTALYWVGIAEASNPLTGDYMAMPISGLPSSIIMSVQDFPLGSGGTNPPLMKAQTMIGSQLSSNAFSFVGPVTDDGSGPIVYGNSCNGIVALLNPVQDYETWGLSGGRLYFPVDGSNSPITIKHGLSQTPTVCFITPIFPYNQVLSGFPNPDSGNFGHSITFPDAQTVVVTPTDAFGYEFYWCAMYQTLTIGMPFTCGVYKATSTGVQTWKHGLVDKSGNPIAPLTALLMANATNPGVYSLYSAVQLSGTFYAADPLVLTAYLQDGVKYFWFAANTPYVFKTPGHPGV